MRLRTVSVLLLLVALYLVMTVAAQVFIDDNLPHLSDFANVLVGTLLTGVAALAVDIEVPS